MCELGDSCTTSIPVREYSPTACPYHTWPEEKTPAINANINLTQGSHSAAPLKPTSNLRRPDAEDLVRRGTRNTDSRPMSDHRLANTGPDATRPPGPTHDLLGESSPPEYYSASESSGSDVPSYDRLSPGPPAYHSEFPYHVSRPLSRPSDYMAWAEAVENLIQGFETRHRRPHPLPGLVPRSRRPREGVFGANAEGSPMPRPLLVPRSRRPREGAHGANTEGRPTTLQPTRPGGLDLFRPLSSEEIFDADYDPTLGVGRNNTVRPARPGNTGPTINSFPFPGEDFEFEYRSPDYSEDRLRPSIGSRDAAHNQQGRSFHGESHTNIPSPEENSVFEFRSPGNSDSRLQPSIRSGDARQNQRGRLSRGQNVGLPRRPRFFPPQHDDGEPPS
ncbi:hypothetical protein MMC19_004760 [Ptychographa xylographoides]|nr:hypothetical protein [Ptychographa xylographoides]